MAPSVTHDLLATTPPHHSRSPSPPRASTSASVRAPAPTVASPSKIARRFGPPPSTRRRFTADDFVTPDWSDAQVEQWVKKYPALTKRNFFVLQSHAKLNPEDFDLLLQVDNKLISLCIPSRQGLTNAPHKGQEDDFTYGRKVIECGSMEVNAALLEGGGNGSRLCVDIGTYTILPMTREVAAKRRKKERIRRQGFSDDTTTDEGESDEERETPDEEQETRFAEALHHNSFLPLPSRWGMPGKGVTADTGDRRGFVIELNGQRHIGLCLQFQRWSLLSVNRPARGGEALGGVFRTFQRQWYFNLDSRPRYKGSIIPFNGLSLLTHRTMDEIESDKAKSATTIRDWRHWNSGLAVKWDELGEKGLSRPWNKQWDPLSSAREREEEEEKARERRNYWERLQMKGHPARGAGGGGRGLIRIVSSLA